MAILINLEGYMQLNNLSRGVLSEEINVSRLWGTTNMSTFPEGFLTKLIDPGE